MFLYVGNLKNHIGGFFQNYWILGGCIFFDDDLIIQ